MISLQCAQELAGMPEAINGFGLLQAVQHLGFTGKDNDIQFCTFLRARVFGCLLSLPSFHLKMSLMC